MIQLPAVMFPHEVTVEPYRGAGAYGPLYGSARKIRCLQVDEVKLMRDATTGDQVSSSAQLYCPRGTTVPAQSRVTLGSGSVRVAMRAVAYDAGALALPSTVVVYLQ